MRRDAVIREIRAAVRERRLVFTGHALDEMDAEGETRESVAAALAKARSFTLQDNHRWRVHGEGLTVIVHIEEGRVIVWTVFAS